MGTTLAPNTQMYTTYSTDFSLQMYEWSALDYLINLLSIHPNGQSLRSDNIYQRLIIQEQKGEHLETDHLV